MIRQIDFAKNAKRILTIAVVLMCVSLCSLLVRGLDFGIDFRGGTIVTIELHKQFETKDIRKITDKYDKKAEVTSSGDDKTQVVISTSKNLSDKQRVSLFKDFQSAYKLKNKDLLSIDKVSGSIGGELRSMAIKASIIAVICMLIYITLRFEFLQGVCAVVALLFDLMMVIGVFSLFQIQVNSSFIAAVLTILGYSINDTIVTFDRVRENTPKVVKGDYYNLINISINQTMRRSINTTVTTLLAVTPLLVFGTSSIREFVFPMMVGFVSGVFSSVALAVPLWYVLKAKQDRDAPLNAHLPDHIQQEIREQQSQNEPAVEKTEEELEMEREERKARRKARKARKKARKKGQR